MIDAYEIGIQLALQDGVSAGLEVIGRELAEVDRAVAVTSAGLMALTRVAETAVRSVAAATGVRVPTVAKVVETGPGKEAGHDDASRGRPDPEGGPGERAMRSPSSVPLQGAPTAPRTMPAVETAPAPDRAPASAPSVAAALADRPAAAPVAGHAVAGRQNGNPATPVVVRQAISVPVRESVTPSAQSATVPSASREAPPAPAVLRPIGEASAVPEKAATASLAARGGVAAVVVRSEPQVEPTAPPRRPRRATVAQVLRERAASAPQAPPEAGAALPWMPAGQNSAPPVNAVRFGGGGYVPAAPVAGATFERSAAPQPEMQERNQSSMGSVMLDGRLVGYWLTERMAREASRPSGGTSFFDPRQAPAWTPSGAL